MKRLLLGVLLLVAGCEVSNLDQKTTDQKGQTPLPEIEANDYRSLNYSDAYLFKSDSSGFQGFTGIVNWQVILPVIDDARTNLQTNYVAVFGILEADGFYSYHQQMLGFSPEAVQEANGNVRPYIYEIIDLLGLSDEVKRVAIAYIPDSELAKKELTTWLHPKSMSVVLDSLLHTKSVLPQCTYMCTMVSADQLKSATALTDVLYCYPVSCSESDIVVEGSVPTDGGSDFNWPSANTDGNTGSSSSGSSSNTGEGEGGNDSCPPPYNCGSPEQASDEDDSEEESTEEEPPEPCDTEDPILDNEVFQINLNLLWQSSQPDEPISERTEQGGFIVSDGNDYSIINYPSDWIRNACQIDPPNDFLNDVPENIVGVIHTHPFFSGDDTTSPAVCGSGGPTNYSSGSNLYDFEFLTAVMNYTNNFNLKSYIIDGDNILSINLFLHIITTKRCGY
ncbi:MAG: hypothetical protein JJ966_12025 [Balneolaceae bacterium]|nr:hypothetical protein [Balneolaceae bacterium]